MGHVIPRLRELREKDPSATLPVTFILATNPDSADKLHGHVVEIAPSAETNGEKGNAVRMRVAFDQQELAKLVAGAGVSDAALAALKQELKVGADVKAKIDCGRRPVGYVLFHELWEFIQSRILFRM